MTLVSPAALVRPHTAPAMVANDAACSAGGQPPLPTASDSCSECNLLACCASPPPSAIMDIMTRLVPLLFALIGASSFHFAGASDDFKAVMTLHYLPHLAVVRLEDSLDAAFGSAAFGSAAFGSAALRSLPSVSVDSPIVFALLVVGLLLLALLQLDVDNLLASSTIPESVSQAWIMSLRGVKQCLIRAWSAIGAHRLGAVVASHLFSFDRPYSAADRIEPVLAIIDQLVAKVPRRPTTSASRTARLSCSSRASTHKN